ncbi:hypothetical protein [Aeromonas caviae]|uniref:hypothetical protein n=1 Tax=Aeromonas caviae TaxID=648 RepID=UPI002B46F5BF|nr:hypothetical protein [Aeromonas caviae]
METTGSECELGGGGDNGGGDNGGGGNGDVGPNAPMYHSPATWVGNLQSANLAPAFDSVSRNIERLKNLVGQESRASRYEMSFMVKDLAKIAQNTSGMNGGAGTYGPLLYEMNAHLKSLSEKSVFEPNFWNDKDIARTNQLSDMRQDISYLGGELLHISDILSSGGGSSGGGSSGGDGGGSSSADISDIKGMMQTAMGWWGGTPGNLTAISGQLSGISNSVAPMFPMLEHFNKQQTALQTQMAGDLASIKNALESGQGSGGSGNEGGADIDYSKMPGSADNPLHVAKSEYESPLCSGDASCAFDLEQITKVYDEQKEALKSQYLAIKDEMADMFKYQFSGSASVPKCFDMFSIFGKDYQVCPDSDGYWDFLAALMMFIFYFTAFIILTRR